MNTYYWLVKITSQNNEVVGHIPVPFLIKTTQGYNNMVELIKERQVLNRSQEFTCPICSRKGFYKGICDECQDEGEKEEELTFQDKLKELLRNDFKNEIMDEFLNKNLYQIEIERQVKFFLVTDEYRDE